LWLADIRPIAATVERDGVERGGVKELRETYLLTLSRSTREPFAFVSLCHAPQRRVTTDGLCGSLNDLGMAVEIGSASRVNSALSISLMPRCAWLRRIAALTAFRA
jgi:hypothetical protein